MLTDAAPAPIKGVIFDFHATLVDGGDPGRWITAAVRHLAAAGLPEPELSAGAIEGLRDHLRQIWQHAHTIDPGSERDLSPARHREVFNRAVALYPGLGPDLVDALYAVMRDQWIAFADTLPVLRELKARGLKIAVLSNIGLDIRPCLDRAGVSDLLDGVVLSFEVGLVKPDPAIYARTLKVLDLAGDQTLMVGDSARADVGGVSLQIRSLILPRTEGPVHGLGMVLRMVGNDAGCQRLRFRLSHLAAVRDGSKRVTLRFNDPVRVGPARLVFEGADEISLPGRITSTVAKTVGGITDDEAQEDGFASAAEVLRGLRDYYPELRSTDEIVIVRFAVDDE